MVACGSLHSMGAHRWAVIVTVAIDTPPDADAVAFGRMQVSLRDNPTDISSPLCFDCGTPATGLDADRPCTTPPRDGYPQPDTAR